MKFTEILEELKKGEKVTREKWEKPGDSCAIDFIMYDQKKDKCEFYRDGKYYDEFVWVYEDIIAEDWKIYEEPNKKWQLEEGKVYYLILTHGFIADSIYDSDSRVDNERLSFGNCFKTRKEAQHMVEKLKIITKLRELSNIDFYDCETKKYALYYSPRYKSVSIQEHNCVKELPFSVYFATKEDCQKAIDIIGEENLKKYYFDIED